MPPGIEAEAFRALNAVVEPLVGAGLLGAPGPGRPGLVVLETRGRRTGRAITVPLLATRVGLSFVVATARAGRSQWLKNISARPDVRVWSGGRAVEVTATVLPCRPSPPGPCGSGFAVAVLRPRTEAPGSGSRAAGGGDDERRDRREYLER